MTQLRDKEEAKRLFIYRCCIGVFCLEGLIIMAVGLIVGMYPHDNDLHGLGVVAFMAGNCLTLMACGVMAKLKLSQYVKTAQHELPYKLRYDPIYRGLGVLFFLVFPVWAIPHAIRSGSLWPIIGGVLISLPVVWGILLSFDHVTLFRDHLLCRSGGKKRRVYYAFITKVEAGTKRAQRGRNYAIRIQHSRGEPWLLDINISVLHKSDCMFMLQLIGKYLPDERFDLMALQMKQGQFPE